MSAPARPRGRRVALALTPLLLLAWSSDASALPPEVPVACNVTQILTDGHAADGTAETFDCGTGEDVASADPEDTLVGCECSSLGGGLMQRGLRRQRPDDAVDGEPNVVTCGRGKRDVALLDRRDRRSGCERVRRLASPSRG